MNNTINNIPKRSNQFTHAWTTQETNFVINNIKLMSYKQMGEFISRSQSSIQSKVRFLVVGRKVNKYRLNQSFFEKWTNQMAYVLGFITADGNVCKTGNSHMIQIACDDKDVITKIKTVLSSNSPIKLRQRANKKISYQIRFSDKKIYYDLYKLGIKPNKSLTVQPPKNIPKKLVNHYVRGIFDGDGSVWISKRGRNKRIVSVFYTASIKMAQFLYKTVKETCPLFEGNIQKIPTPNGNNMYYSINLSSRDSLLLYKYMYNDADIFLGRKHNIFKKSLCQSILTN